MGEKADSHHSAVGRQTEPIPLVVPDIRSFSAKPVKCWQTDTTKYRAWWIGLSCTAFMGGAPRTESKRFARVCHASAWLENHLGIILWHILFNNSGLWFVYKYCMLHVEGPCV